jgi:PAT family beta-lactamase induction signal transducer AmpG
MQRRGWQHAVLVLAFIFLYKLGDSMATALATPFYIELGFTRTEIGLVAKNAGLWASILGGILGAYWMLKTGVNKALWLFGLLQAVAIIGFAILAQTALETNPRFTATQFALFTSLSAVPRTFINALTGYIVELTGWTNFFIICFILAIPGLLLLPKIAPWNKEKQSDFEKAV